jgi:hypothetical protein
MIHITVTDANGEHVAGESFESVDAAYKWLARVMKSQRLKASQPAQDNGYCHCAVSWPDPTTTARRCANCHKALKGYQ